MNITYIQCLSSMTNTSRLREVSLDKCNTRPGCKVTMVRLSSASYNEAFDWLDRGYEVKEGGAVALAILLKVI